MAKTVGYSGTPLVKKLGIKEGFKIHIHRAPKDYSKTLGSLPKEVVTHSKMRKNLDFIQWFTTSASELEVEIARLRLSIAQNGMIWISWPKGASKVPTDVNENVVRDIALRNGLVDVKVCAVDEIWSGLKLVIPVKDRKE